MSIRSQFHDFVPLLPCYAYNARVPDPIRPRSRWYNHLDCIGTPLEMNPELRDFAKKVILSALSASGAIRFGEFLSRDRVLALTYHRVVPRAAWTGAGRPVNTLFTDEFEAQMEFLSRRFHVLDRNELRAVVANERRAPRYSAVITFDDGYENNFTHALPILQRFGLHAVFFVTSNLIGDSRAVFWFDRLDQVLAAAPYDDVQSMLGQLDPSLLASNKAALRSKFKRLTSSRQGELLTALETHFRIPNCAEANPDLYRSMTWDHVRALATAGMTVGSHTRNHQILSAVEPALASEEVRLSREKIESEIGEECLCFGYPNGQSSDFRKSDEQAIKEAGYLCAFTQVPGSIDSQSNRYALPRIPIPDVGDLTIFRTYVSGLHLRLAGMRL